MLVNAPQPPAAALMPSATSRGRRVSAVDFPAAQASARQCASNTPESVVEQADAMNAYHEAVKEPSLFLGTMPPPPQATPPQAHADVPPPPTPAPSTSCISAGGAGGGINCGQRESRQVLGRSMRRASMNKAMGLNPDEPDVAGLSSRTDGNFGGKALQVGSMEDQFRRALSDPVEVKPALEMLEEELADAAELKSGQQNQIEIAIAARTKQLNKLFEDQVAAISFWEQGDSALFRM